MATSFDLTVADDTPVLLNDTGREVGHFTFQTSGDIYLAATDATSYTDASRVSPGLVQLRVLSPDPVYVVGHGNGMTPVVLKVFHNR